jgi:hypothetical protein
MKIIKGNSKKNDFKFKPEKIIFYTNAKPKIPLVFFRKKNKNENI